MKNPKTEPQGRTRLLGSGGAPVADGQQPPTALPFEVQRGSRATRPNVPRSHGNRDWETLNRIGMARREGNDPIPSWQRTMRAGCTGCMARPGLLPPDHEQARGMLLEWGWVWAWGRWLCPACAQEVGDHS